MGQVCALRIIMKPYKPQGRTADPQVKNVGEERQGKKVRVVKKCPFKAVALAVDEKAKAIKSSQGRAQSRRRPPRAQETRVECRWHGKVSWK